MTDGKLKGRTAVVTGAGQGIGRAIAERYATEGAEVAVVDLNEDKVNEVAAAIAARGGAALPVVCDVADRAQVVDAAQVIAELCGPVNVLVSNAGITRPAMAWNMTVDEFDAVIDVHVKGSFYWLQEVLGPMREARSGSVILTSSGAGLIGSVGQLNYATAKAALLGMTRAAALELADSNITVNAVAPAAATPMTEKIRTDDRFKDRMLASIPLGRWAEAEEIAGAYVFLASDDARYITGQVLSVDGGRVMVR
ncbi:SDR family NAD(P)-dependent oxidoreductase [Amycolatopsis sp. NPDC006131]|uniref:SDR family oxidoreductase n=1 Tax=Amycolatopsis sp. NPDC006131 TaxID=3156731 RepID=UPI0033B8685F